MPPEITALLSDWVVPILIGTAWLLRELFRWHVHGTDVNAEFAERMMQREADLVARVTKVEQALAEARVEITELRLMLARNGIDPDGGNHAAAKRRSG